jgi:hypothetical protein
MNKGKARLGVLDAAVVAIALVWTSHAKLL